MTITRHIEIQDLPCKGCGDYMSGIVDYKTRRICESCGGNTTEYHADNPLPGGMTDTARKQASA